MKAFNNKQIFTRDARLAFAETDKPTTLSGYAVIWGATSSDRGGYQVRFMPGSATFATPSLALFHHDYRFVLGNTANNTLRLSSDDVGVKVEIDLPGTQTAHDLTELVSKGYVQGMSFSMVDVQDSREVTEGGNDILEVSKFTLDEVTVTAIPAFTETSIGIKANQTDKSSYSNRINQGHQLAKIKLDMLEQSFAAVQ